MAKRKFKEQKKKGRKAIISQVELDEKIANIIYRTWPKLCLTQQSIADELEVSQSLISKRLSAWENSKDSLPLILVRQNLKNRELEKKIATTYGLSEVVVLTSTTVSTKDDFRQIGKYASDLLINKIKGLADKIENNTIKITTSCGNGVLATIMSLVEMFRNTDIKLEFSSCIALRSNTLIELTPIHIVAQLLNLKFASEDKKVHIDVKRTFQLPEIELQNEKKSDVIIQRAKTQDTLNFIENIKSSHIVILGLGNVQKSSPGSGFNRLITNLHAESFFKRFNLIGEIAYAPFNEKGFLFHHLVKEVFDWEEKEDKTIHFKYSETEQKNKLRRFATSDIEEVTSDDITAALKLLNSIFTVNFCDLEHFNGKKPYVLLVVGGESKKAYPLKILLEKWKKENSKIIDGLVTNEHIAKKLLEK